MDFIPTRSIRLPHSESNTSSKAMREHRTTIREFLGQYFHIGGISDSEDIFSLGFVDSMFAMQLVLFLERTFDVQVEDDDLVMDNFKSVDSMTAFLARKERATV